MGVVALDDQFMTVSGVSPAFAAAMQEYRPPVASATDPIAEMVF